MRPPTTTITLENGFIDTILSVPIGFAFIGLIIVLLIGLVYDLEIYLFISQLYDTITLEIGLIGIVFNGIIVLLSVLIGIGIIALIALLVAIINGLIYGFECGLIVPVFGIKTIVKYDFIGFFLLE